MNVAGYPGSRAVITVRLLFFIPYMARAGQHVSVVSMPDPTMTFLDSLKDTSRWKVVRGVPIFRPHKRKVKIPDGTEQVIEVTEADLPRIVLNMRQTKAESGVVPRITPGHTVKDQKAPETQQPEPWGWMPDYYVGTFGPRRLPAILADFFFRPECYEEAKAYPYRSVEFYPASKEITGVALLKRDPQLDLGIVQYAGRDGGYHYSMDDGGKGGTPADPPDAAAGDKDKQAQPVTSDDPVWQYMCKQYAQYMATQQQTGTGTGTPPPQEPTQMSKQSEEAVRYMKLQQEQFQNTVLKELKELKTARDQDAANYAREKSRRTVDHLIYEGYQLRDPAKEVERMASLTDAQRAEREQEIRENYLRAPVGGDFVPLRPDAIPEGGRDKQPSQKEMDQAFQYMREHEDCGDFDVALEAVRKK